MNFSYTNQFKQFSDFQNELFAPARALGIISVDAMEKFVRKNYEVAGDCVDFSLVQAKLPLKQTNMVELASVQVLENRAFAELMNSRVAEYVELANGFGASAQQAVADATKVMNTESKAAVAPQSEKKAPAKKSNKKA